MRRCPNCGREFDGYMCPDCGRSSPSQGGLGSGCATALFVLLGVPSFLAGSCGLLVVMSSIGQEPSPPARTDPFIMQLGLGSLLIGGALFGLTLWLLIRANKK